MPDDLTARPTMRVLRELSDGWGSVNQRRSIEREAWDDLHPFTELDHPILGKAVSQFGSDPDEDGERGTITCSGDLRLLEVRQGQWRAGVLTDNATGVRWVVAVGLAKGGHQDSDDFYEVLKRTLATSGEGVLLPTADDQRRLKRESAASELTLWELAVQRRVTELLEEALSRAGTAVRASLPAIRGARPIAELSLTWTPVSDAEYTVEEFLVHFGDLQQPGSNLAWTFRMRVLTTLAPPSQDWEIGGNYYSAMEPEGHAAAHLLHLKAANSRGELLASEAGKVSHYTHAKHLAASYVDGKSMRALCGAFFVPTQDPARFEVCPNCQEVRNSLSG